MAAAAGSQVCKLSQTGADIDMPLGCTASFLAVLPNNWVHCLILGCTASFLVVVVVLCLPARSLSLPKEVAPSVLHLLATSAGTSPSEAANQARHKAWPAIRAGLDGLGLPSESVARCRQCVLQLTGGWVQACSACYSSQVGIG